MSRDKIDSARTLCSGKGVEIGHNAVTIDLALLVFFLSGCAVSPAPESINASYVSGIPYQTWTCSQLLQEQSSVGAALSNASTQQEHARSDERVHSVLRMLVPLPPDTGSETIASQVEIAQLKGEQQAVREAMVHNSCSTQVITVENSSTTSPRPPVITVENSSTTSPRPPVAPPSIPKGTHVALVVGNSSYRNVGRLSNPANDARMIAETLRELGFDLVGGGPQLDLDKARFDQLVQQFGRAIPGASAALFYYAGHGLQVQGTNWLVPVDANPARPQDLDFQMVDADLVLRQMDGAGTKLNILILDACRNNPFASRSLRGMDSGLAEMRAPEGSLIAFATEPGKVAADGSGADSPYSAALAGAMRQPGLGIFDTFNDVGKEVKRATGGTQQPWFSSSPIEGIFCFGGCSGPAAGAVPGSQ
jgi:hypothetical protein